MIYVDVFDKIDLIMVNSKKKILKNEVDFTSKKLLHTVREHVSVQVDIKNRMLEAGSSFNKSGKDIIVNQKEVATAD